MIEVTNLNKTYDRGRNANRVLRDVSFTLPDTGFVCILGPSGCGKTSLLNAIGGLDAFDSGTLAADSVKVSRYGTRAYDAQRNRSFGYIFQNYYLLDNHSVAYNVYLGLHSLDLSHREKLSRVRQALRAVDMERYIRRKVGELSGGQQQRIAIARALARRPRVIFADEPTGNLDEANTRNICTLLRKASRESLVIMVTHEESIARFFADRILTLQDGQLISDSTHWQRNQLDTDWDKQIYTQEFCREDYQDICLLRAADAPAVKLTVVAMKDRIVLKLDDGRAVTLSGPGEPPQLIDTPRPVLTLETVDREAEGSPLFAGPPAAQTKAGKGVSFGMMLREARMMMGGRNLKRAGMRIFLILLTVLTMLTAADFITVSHIDPQDFITADSHMLVVTVESGGTLPEGTPPSGYTWEIYHQRAYQDHIAASGLDFQFVPTYTSPPKYSMTLFFQMEDVTLQLPPFSYVPVQRLQESQLLFGRMPENSEEIVVDRILVEAMLETDGIVQNGMGDVSFLLGEKLNYGNKGLNPTVVGISDSGERAIYLTEAAMYALGNRGANAISLSELQSRFPGQYDDLTIADDACIVNIANAGQIWAHREGQTYGYSPNQRNVTGTVDIPDIQAHIIVPDATIPAFIRGTLGQEIHLYCADKEAMKVYLRQKSQAEADGYIRVSVSDPYSETYALYADAARVRADARTIVTATVLVVCMVMLYLLCRARIQEHLGLVAVYRLLGIPKGKLCGIFLLESVLSALGTIVPTAVLTWLAAAYLPRIPELELSLVLPWQAAALVSCGILLYYSLVSLLPMGKLLRLPPAQLAAKYDI